MISRGCGLVIRALIASWDNFLRIEQIRSEGIESDISYLRVNFFLLFLILLFFLFLLGAFPFGQV